MELNPLPDLLNTGYTVIEIGLLHGGEHLEICKFLTFFWQDGVVNFIEDNDVWTVEELLFSTVGLIKTKQIVIYGQGAKIVNLLHSAIL